MPQAQRAGLSSFSNIEAVLHLCSAFLLQQMVRRQLVFSFESVRMLAWSAGNWAVNDLCAACSGPGCTFYLRTVTRAMDSAARRRAVLDARAAVCRAKGGGGCGVRSRRQLGVRTRLSLVSGCWGSSSCFILQWLATLQLGSSTRPRPHR